VKDKIEPKTADFERYIAGEHMTTDDLRIRRWGDVSDGYLGPAFHMRFKPGQVLYGSRRTYLRKVAVPDFEGICSNTTFVLESADPETLLPELLPFVMQTEAFHEHSKRESKGSVNPYVNFTDLAWYEFALPPLEEQRHIIRLLGRARECVESVAAAVESSAALYESLSLNLLTRRTTSRSDPSEWCAENWPVVPLGELTQQDAPICYGIVQVGEDVADGIPTLAIKNLTGSFEKVHRTAPTIETGYARSRVSTGDIVVAIKATIGPIERVPRAFNGNISRDLARIRLNEHLLTPDFFVHLWRSAHFSRYFRSRTVGSTRAELSIAVLRDLLVPVPSLSEQSRVVQALASVDATMATLRRRLHLAKQLQRQSTADALSPGSL
jgi:type I restriction enzyme S subunit